MFVGIEKSPLGRNLRLFPGYEYLLSSEQKTQYLSQRFQSRNLFIIIRIFEGPKYHEYVSGKQSKFDEYKYIFDYP